MKAKLKVDKQTNWGVIPKGTELEVLDDNTPLRQSWRVRAVGAPEVQVFGIDKSYGAGLIELV